MGLNNSKARKKGAAQPTQRLYPNISEEFSTYGPPHTVGFQPPPPYSQEACFGNAIPTWNGQSNYCHPGPSAPPELSTKVPAIGQRLVTQGGSGSNDKNCKNDNILSDKKPCPNARDGCILHFDSEQMTRHVKVCLYTNILCPLNGILENCAWQDKVKHILTHFKDNHRVNIGQVNKATTLTGLRTIHLVLLHPHTFLVHIKVEEDMKKVLIAVQHYNTPLNASKWFYKVLFEFNGQITKKKIHGNCITAATPIEETFDKLQCRVLTITTSELQAFKSGGVKYKYHIMQKTNNRKPVKLEAGKNTASNLKP